LSTDPDMIMQPKRRILLLSAVLALLAATAFVLLPAGCTKKADSLDTVRIGAVTQPVAGLVYVADEKGFFKQRGVNAVIRDYEAGPLAVKGLLAGEADVATAAEFVMVNQGFDNHSLRAFAEIANTNATELVARKDRGIEKISDLKGKKIGLMRGSSSEFFLGSYLRHNNIHLSSVEIVGIGPLATEDAICNGSVDAVVIWEPHVTRIKERLGKNVVSWPIQGRDDYYFLLITSEAFLLRSPATAEKMLRALIDAEGFADKRPEEAQRIIESRNKYPPGDVQLRLARSRLKVRLDQALLTLMEAEAQWMIRNKLTSKKEMPNYLDMIYLKGLETVKPEAVGIIH
jgi:ABC-type nitrate/sulfonate/bicarbonate transport system substrate-binding protein